MVWPLALSFSAGLLKSGSPLKGRLQLCEPDVEFGASLLQFRSQPFQQAPQAPQVLGVGGDFYFQRHLEVAWQSGVPPGLPDPLD